MNIEPFEEPWQWVAADADRSNTLDKADVHLLEDFLLGRNRELPDNEAYRFVDAAHVFPFPYPLEEPLSEIHTLHLDPDRARDQNITLIGIKMGDVDASAKTDVTRPNASLQIAPLALKSGDSCTLTLRMAEGGNWTGIQCALSFDPGKIRLEALQTKELPANIRPMCAQPQAGVLTLGWYDVLPFELQSGQNLVVFRVRALQDVQLADAVRLGEEHLPAEGYDGLFQARTVHLELQEAPDGARGFFEKNGVILNDCFHAEHAARQIANSW